MFLCTSLTPLLFDYVMNHFIDNYGTCKDHIMLVNERQISREHWWDDTDRGKQKHLEKTLSHCHLVVHKSHVDYSGIEPGLCAAVLHI